jgi:hypothetical protein
VRRVGSVGRVGLLEDAVAVGQRQGGRIGETAHAGVRSEVMVERAVLLDQDDHVLDVADAAAGGRRREDLAPQDRRAGADRRGRGAQACAQQGAPSQPGADERVHLPGSDSAQRA